MRVLVTEDECLIRMLVCDILEGAGHHCTEAAHAEEALALLDSGAVQPDLLVTDYNLGPGLNGRELAIEVARRRPGLATVFATGNPEAFLDYPLQPWQRLVPKPFLPAELVAAVECLLAGGWIRSPQPGAAPLTLDSVKGAHAGAGYRQQERPTALMPAPGGRVQPPAMTLHCLGAGSPAGASPRLRSGTKLGTRGSVRIAPASEHNQRSQALHHQLPHVKQTRRCPDIAQRQITADQTVHGPQLDDATMEMAEV